jgi:hypothetical protein
MAAKKGKKKINLHDLKPKKDVKGGIMVLGPTGHGPTGHGPGSHGPAPHIKWGP